jgi:hypothetical protein
MWPFNTRVTVREERPWLIAVTGALIPAGHIWSRADRSEREHHFETHY